jgi:hypothetical protein
MAKKDRAVGVEYLEGPGFFIVTSVYMLVEKADAILEDARG